MPMRIKTRRPDPPRQSQLAALLAASRRESARTEIERRLAKLGELAALAKSMVQSAPPPPTVPKPPAPPPPPQAFGPLIDANTSPATRRAILRAQSNVAHGSAPCTLSAKELAKGMPSDWTLRCWRRAQEKFEAEEQKARKPDRPGQLMFDPITHKLVRRVSHG
jgi:hypothetical protein